VAVCSVVYRLPYLRLTFYRQYDTTLQKIRFMLNTVRTLFHIALRLNLIHMIGVSNYVFVDKIMYGGIRLIQHPWDWRGAILSDIPDYQTGGILASVIKCNW
jgi:hypothetical protein